MVIVAGKFERHDGEVGDWCSICKHHANRFVDVSPVSRTSRGEGQVDLEVAARLERMRSLSDHVVGPCGECDPSFGCFNGSAPCSKLPLHAEDVPGDYLRVCARCVAHMIRALEDRRV